MPTVNEALGLPKDRDSAAERMLAAQKAKDIKDKAIKNALNFEATPEQVRSLLVREKPVSIDSRLSIGDPTAAIADRLARGEVSGLARNLLKRQESDDKDKKDLDSIIEYDKLQKKIRDERDPLGRASNPQYGKFVTGEPPTLEEYMRFRALGRPEKEDFILENINSYYNNWLFAPDYPRDLDRFKLRASEYDAKHKAADEAIRKEAILQEYKDFIKSGADLASWSDKKDTNKL